MRGYNYYCGSYKGNKTVSRNVSCPNIDSIVVFAFHSEPNGTANRFNFFSTNILSLSGQKLPNYELLEKVKSLRFAIFIVAADCYLRILRNNYLQILY